MIPTASVASAAEVVRAQLDHGFQALGVDLGGMADTARPEERVLALLVGCAEDGVGVDDSAEPFPLFPGVLVVTEVLAAPSRVEDPFGEYVEVTSRDDHDLELEGIVIEDGGGRRATVTRSLTLPALARVVLGASDALLDGGVVDRGWGLGALDLGDRRGAVRVLAPDGTLLDAVDWDESWPTVDGASLSLSEHAMDPSANDFPRSWCPSTSRFGTGDRGTPGRPNDPC